jgi:hypothetical protein
MILWARSIQQGVYICRCSLFFSPASACIHLDCSVETYATALQQASFSRFSNMLKAEGTNLCHPLSSNAVHRSQICCMCHCGDPQMCKSYIDQYAPMVFTVIEQVRPPVV